MTKAEAEQEAARRELERLSARAEAVSREIAEREATLEARKRDLGAQVLAGGDAGALAGALAREEELLRGLRAGLAAMVAAQKPLVAACRVAAEARLQELETACRRKFAELDKAFAQAETASKALEESYHTWHEEYGRVLYPLLPREERGDWHIHLAQLGQLHGALQRRVFPLWRGTARAIRQGFGG